MTKRCCRYGRTAGLMFIAGASVATGTALAADSIVLEEIVVTAQKREERLSETPLSITALSGRNLESLAATQFRDFANTIPSLGFTTEGVGQTQVSLRGITTGNNISPTVGIYVDEVPYGSSTPFAAAAQLALDVGLFDIDRIEVLRGPQGTLYGASTMGGLLKYVSVAPDPSAFSGLVRGGVSSTSEGGVGYDAGAVINAPFASNTAALRVSGFYTRDGGFIDNVALNQDDVNEADVYGGRADLLFQPTDQLSIRVGAFAQNVERDGSAAADYDIATGRPIEGDLEQNSLLPEPFEQEFRLASLVVGYDFGGAALTSITSYQTSKTEAGTDVSDLFVPLLQLQAGITLGKVGLVRETETDKFTQEVRLSANGSRFDWLIGGFYTKEDSDHRQRLPAYDPTGAAFPLELLTVSIPSEYEESAVFGTLTLHATDKLDFIAGARYASNDQSQEQIGSGVLVGSIPERSNSESVTTYSATVRYRATETFMPYARVATGYRPGGPNAVVVVNGQPLAPPTFDSDSLTSYEAGIKASTSDRRFGIDVALYYIDWDDLQVNAVRNGLGVVANAKAAESRGAELTVTAVPVPSLTLVGAFAYTDAELSEDAPDLGGRAGETLPDTPEFSGSLAADLSFPMGSYEGFVGTTLRYVDTRVNTFEQGSFPQYELPDYTSVDLRTGIDLGETRVQLYARNITDERGQLSAATGFAVLGGPAEVSLLQPRTYGLNVNVKF